MNFTRALHLRRWCDNADARGLLPQLMRKLISASGLARRIDFPTFEDVQQAGWDGVVEAAAGNSFIPAGLSLWELSTEARIVAKAEADLAKRAIDPLGFEKAQAAIVFVTPRRWPNRRTREAWENDQRASGGWRDVRVIDAGDLEAWLENAPAVDWWLAHLLGLRPVGASDFARHWAALSSIAEPKLKPCVFLASRASAVERLDRWIAAKPAALSIEASTAGEVVDFVGAWLAERENIESRALLVESRDAWRALASPGSPLLLVAHSTLKLETEVVSGAIINGHHVILPTHISTSDRLDILSLPPVRYHHLHEALIACGFGFESAARHAREVGGHLGVLKRRLAATVGMLPAWAVPPAAIDLAPFVLAGAWDNSKDGDLEVLATLTGQDSARVAALARRWARAEDALLIEKECECRFTSREEAWCLLARQFTREQLNRFCELAVSVLGDCDPRYTLPMAERAYASMRRQVPKQSWVMREGIAETLTLLGLGGDGLNGDRIAARVVRQLLHGADWQRWASVSMLLPLLAEAAPDVFLTAAEADLASAEPALVRLMLEEDQSSWGASHPHTGMLWAFEVLSWSPDYLSRASLCLAQLARLDAGGKLCNRPMRSLHDTFLPWAPHTGATPEQRLQVLDHLLAREPQTTWQLLFAYLPHHFGCTNPRAKPRWQAWADYDLRKVPYEEYASQVNAIADRIVAFSDGKNGCWPMLLEKLERFPERHTKLLLEQLEALGPDCFESVEAVAFWNQLRAKVAWHRRCDDKAWAMHRTVTEAVDKITKRFEPEDPLELHAWLFLPRALMEFYEQDAGYELSRSKLEAAQIAALRDIVARHGFEGIQSLVARAGHSWATGFHVAEQQIFSDDSRLLPAGLDSSDENWRSFVLGYAAGRFKQGGWEWLDSLHVNAWSSEQAGWLSHLLSFNPVTWRWFEQVAPEHSGAYWRRANPWPSNLSASELDEAVSRLIGENRANAAIDLLHSALSQKKALAHPLISRGLEAFLVTAEEPPNGDAARESAWHVCELMEHITTNPELPTEQLAQLEWGFLGLLLARQHSPRTLLDWMGRSPAFFSEVVAAAYSKPEKDENGLTTRRQHAMELLRAWRRLPKTSADGTVDAAALTKWCDEAREACGACGCRDVGDLVIGMVFATSPPAADGSWPAIAVRDCIERFASERIERGFHMGVFNSRGITTHAPGEGGEQERTLATRFRGNADACKFRWPRTARQLTDLANYYEEDARRRDRDALDE